VPAPGIELGIDDTIERRRGARIAAERLPRPGAPLAEPLRQSQRSALAER